MSTGCATMAGMAISKRWPSPKAEWQWPKPDDWSTPGSRERIDFLDSGSLMPGDYVELKDGRRMQAVLRYTRRGEWGDPIPVLGLIDA